jgi:hypothetical protein
MGRSNVGALDFGLTGNTAAPRRRDRADFVKKEEWVEVGAGIAVGIGTAALRVSCMSPTEPDERTMGSAHKLLRTVSRERRIGTHARRLLGPTRVGMGLLSRRGRVAVEGKLVAVGLGVGRSSSSEVTKDGRREMARGCGLRIKGRLSSSSDGDATASDSMAAFSRGTKAAGSESLRLRARVKGDSGLPSVG